MWRTKKDFKDIEAQWNILKNYGSATHSERYLFVTETINILDITLVSASNDFSKAAIALSASNVQTFTGTTFNFVFQFSYEYSWMSSGKGVGTATGTAKSYTITKTWDKLSTTPQVTIAIEIETARITLSGAYEGDAEVNRIAVLAMNDFFATKVASALSTDLADDINVYFVKAYKGNKWNVTTKFPEIALGMTVDTNQPPKNLEKGVVYYNRFDIDIGPLSQADPVTWDSFDETKGAHQVFFHQSFFQGVCAEVVKKNRFSFSLFEGNKPSSITTVLNVDTIGSFYPSKYIYIYN